MSHKVVKIRMPSDTRALIIASAHVSVRGTEMRQKIFGTEELQDDVIEIGDEKENENEQN